MSRPLTYAEVGATRGDTFPPGYHHARRCAVVGRGRADFDAVAAGLVRWEVQRGAGVRVDPDTPEVRDGAEVVAAAGVGPLRLPVPFRVVWTVREPDRVGFAYGTLEGHPLRGEEAFVVSLGGSHPAAGGDPDAVVFSVVAFSQPATWYTRVGGPVGRLAQRGMATAYVRAARRLAAAR